MASQCWRSTKQLLPEKVGAKPIDGVLAAMLEGLQA
jgi:hypothetical protein